SYAPADQVTLAGGVRPTPAVLSVTNTEIFGLFAATAGVGVYAPADTIHLTGGTQTTPAVLSVVTTFVTAAAIASAGSGGTNGSQTVTGTTGTGTKFQAKVTVTGGAIASVDLILVSGLYSINPTVPSAEPVTGGSDRCDVEPIPGGSRVRYFQRRGFPGQSAGRNLHPSLYVW